MRKKFVRVFLHSGSMNNPMGEEDIAVYCQCNEQEPSVQDVDITDLEKWVNSNTDCKKNQSNEKYRVSNRTEAMTIITMDDREIKCCDSANRIYPRLNLCAEG